MTLPRHIIELATRVRGLERQLATTARDLNAALADLDAACVRHFDTPPASAPRDLPSGWHPPAQDSDEVEARVAAVRQALVAHGEQVAAHGERRPAGAIADRLRRPLPAGVVRR